MRGEIDEGMEKGGVMTAMLKDLFDLEETAIRREAIMTSLGLCGAVAGRGGLV